MEDIPENPFVECETIFNPEISENILQCRTTMSVDLGPTQTGDEIQVLESEVTFPSDFRGPPQLPGTTVSTADGRTTMTVGVETSRNGGGAKEATPTATPTVVWNDDNDDDGPGSIGQKGGGGGIAPGAVAGIAISTAIIGAAIAFLVAFLLFKRRNHRERRRSGTALAHPELSSWPKPPPNTIYQMPQQHTSHSRNISMASETGANASTPLNTFRHSHGAVSSTTIVAAMKVPPTAISASATTEDYLTSLGGILPPPAETDTIRSRFTVLFAQIHSHVETFYRDVNASITPSMEPALAQFGTHTGNGGMAELLQTVGNPTTAIKHALVAYVLGIASPVDGEREGSEGEGRSLFPGGVVGLAGGMLTEGLKGERHDTDTTTAYTLYRRLSAHLYTTLCAPPATRRTSLLESAQHFALTFFPWANPLSSDTEKDEDLAQIISETLDAVLWLYGSGQEFEWTWELEGGRLMRGEGDVVVRPGVVVGGRRVLDAVGGF